MQSALSPAGPQAATMAALWWVMFWVSITVFIAVVVVMLTAVTHRRGPNGVVSSPVVDPGPERGTSLVVSGAVAVTILILFVFLIASVVSGRALHTPPSQDALTIDVVGHQWWWEIRYDAPLPSERFTTANEMHVPVGRPVVVRLTSSDVIHSFWIPSLHGKRDLIPGHRNLTWFQADRPGTYRGQCAEFCGLQHAHMALTVIAESEAAFANWLARQRRPAAEPSDPTARRGRDVFVQGPCAMCHRIRGTTAGATVAPDLTHVAGRTTLAAGTLPNRPGHLAGWIMDPQSVKPGALMPAQSLGADEFRAVLAYLGTLQ